MFEKYNEKARRALFFARYEASKLGSRVIESEHILLGILREGEETVGEILRRFQVKPEDIRREIEGERVFVERISSTAELPLSEESKKILAYASHEAESMLHATVGSEHLLIGILRVEGCMAMRILTQHGFDVYTVREEVLSIAKEREASQQKKELPFLSEYGRDLTALAAESAFDPLIGRDEEVDRIIQILSRRTKNNPILLGEPGVGKTAIVEGLADRIVEGRVPIFLANKRIVALDLSLIVAGTKYRGQFEERLKGILKELKESKELIVFIDEIHSLIGAGSAEGSLDAANILKPALSRGEISCIGATTLKEYRKYIEKDRSLLRRFQAIQVNPPTPEQTQEILEGVKDRYESFHKVRYRAEALRTAIYQSSRYIPDRHLPDKAIDVIDEAGARVKLRRVRDTQNLRRLEQEIRQVVKEMKVAISDKDVDRGGRDGRAGGDPPRHRGGHLVVDRHPGRGPAERGGGAAAAHGGDPQAARHRPGPLDFSHQPRHPAFAPGRLQPAAAGGLVHLPGPLGRRQDRGGAPAFAVPVRQPAGAGALRHERVHGEARRLQAHRLAAGLRRARGRGPAHRARAPPALLADPVRRDREGAPGRRQPAPPDPGGRHADRRLRQPGRLQEHPDPDDLQHRQQAGAARWPHGLRRRERAGELPAPRGRDPGRAAALVQPRVHQPHR